MANQMFSDWMKIIPQIKKHKTNLFLNVWKISTNAKLANKNM